MQPLLEELPSTSRRNPAENWSDQQPDSGTTIWKFVCSSAVLLHPLRRSSCASDWLPPRTASLYSLGAPAFGDSSRCDGVRLPARQPPETQLGCRRLHRWLQPAGRYRLIGVFYLKLRFPRSGPPLTESREASLSATGLRHPTMMKDLPVRSFQSP